MSQKELAVIGGSGFIGRNLIGELHGQYEITSVSKGSSVEGVRNLPMDLLKTDFSFLESEGFDAVVYLGTVSSPKEAEAKPQEAFDSNVVAVQRFLEAARQYNIRKIILFSSAVLYADSDGRPLAENDRVDPFLSPYNYSKFTLETLAEYYRKKHGLEVTVFRLSNTYGPGQTTAKAPYLVPSLFRQALENGKIEVKSTKPVRDWVFIKDVSKVIQMELLRDGSGIFNLGSGKGRSVREVVEIISKLTEVPFEDLNEPVAPPYQMVCDTRKLRDRIGYVPDTSLEDGLRNVFDSLKNGLRKTDN